MSDDVDWTTTDGCPRCNEHGPYEDFTASGEAARDVHQAWHELVAGLLPWQRVLLGANRVAQRLTLPRRKPPGVSHPW